MVHFREACLHCPLQAGLKQLCLSQEGTQAYFRGRTLWKYRIFGVTTVDGPDLLTQSQGNLRQYSKTWNWKVPLFNMESKWEGILTGRQSKRYTDHKTHGGLCCNQKEMLSPRWGGHLCPRVNGPA